MMSNQDKLNLIKECFDKYGRKFIKNGKTFEKYSSDLQDYLSDFISKEKEQDKEVDL